ncbi:hypothetical protein BDF14DRAFT_501783 [Spinellus fusiger]|nr:hypothetical protein BDF14DRAFT_501783 [Spinellus fusiger]
MFVQDMKRNASVYGIIIETNILFFFFFRGRCLLLLLWLWLLSAVSLSHTHKTPLLIHHGYTTVSSMLLLLLLHHGGIHWYVHSSRHLTNNKEKRHARILILSRIRTPCTPYTLHPTHTHTHMHTHTCTHTHAHFIIL